MAARTTLLDEAMEAWMFARDGVLDELRNIPEKDLSFRPAPEARSALDLVQHIIESGLMMAGELARPDGDFRRKSYEGFLHEYGRGVRGWRSKAPLLAALRKTHADGEKKLRQAGELHMLQHIKHSDDFKRAFKRGMSHIAAHQRSRRPGARVAQALGI